jgi:hypothetical protein
MVHMTTNNYTLADSTELHQLKNLIRDATRTIDSLPIKVYPDTIEGRQVKHEISVLLSELQAHGLLPQLPNKSQDIPAEKEH